MKQRFVGFLLLLCTLGLFQLGTSSAPAQTTSPGTTWYIRPDGGTRWSANRVSTNGPGGLNYSTIFTAQCDGKHDAPYPAVGTLNVLGVASTGVNQPCAFNDYRYLWLDQTYANNAWVIAGGDTVILRGGPWRVGEDLPGAAHSWCYGGQGSIQCVNPTIPAGTASQPTRILGENYASCHTGDNNGVGGVADRSKMTQIFGGMAAYTPMNLAGAQHVVVSCLEITRHSQCSTAGGGNYSGRCTLGVDDYDADGIEEDNQTSDVTLTDLWVHGHPGRGVKGAIGGVVTANRVTLGYNGGAGWDFDNGQGSGNAGDTMPPGATWNFLYSTIEWSGCNQEYPIVHQFPAISCYGQQTGGYGDGVGSAPGQWFNSNIDHSTFRYNVQDGLDLGHEDGNQVNFLHVTNSTSYANGGGTFKWGWGFTDILFENNLAKADCFRLNYPIGDAPYLNNSGKLSSGDMCRSGDALSFNFNNNSRALFANNTIVTYAPTTFDYKCVTLGTQQNCAQTVFTLTNNIIRAYGDTLNGDEDYGGHPSPGGYCGASCNNSTTVAGYNGNEQGRIGTINRDHNIYYGLNQSCVANVQTPDIDNGTSTNEQCIDPAFVGEPAGIALTSEAELDNFNFNIAANSPAKFAGAHIASIATDYNTYPYANPPSIGAMEFGSTPTVTTTTPTPAPTTPATRTLTSLTFSAPNPVTLIVGGTATPTCQATFSDSTTSTCAAAGAILSSDAPTSASVSATGTLTAVTPGAGHLLATVGSVTGSDPFTISAPPKPTASAVTFTSLNPIALTVGSSATPTCTVTFSDSSTASCLASGAVFSSDAAAFANATASGTLTAIAAGTGHLIATVGSVTGSDAFSIAAAKPTLKSLAFSSPNPITLLIGASVTPTCTATFSDATTSSCTSAGATLTSDAASFASATASGTLTASATGTGHLVATVGSISATDPFTVTAPPAKAVAITITHPALGFHVIPRSTRRIFAGVTNGATSQVTWAVKSGSAQISSSSGSWVDVVAGAAGSSCQLSPSGTSVASTTQFTIEATSVDDTSKAADITFSVCNPAVQISTVPAYRTLYAGQTADIQSLIVGAVNDQVHWAITTQPTGGDGKLADAASRDTLFTATIPGRYTLTVTSGADQSKIATSILYVTGHVMPYRVTPNRTEPVDCTVDPSLSGKTYDVGPSQTYKHLRDLPLATLTAGSTIRLHNEDTTALTPTTYNEYLQISEQATADQPIRLCGLPDALGNLPILDATNAVGRSDTTSSVAGTGLVLIGGSTTGAAWPAFKGAQNVIIEGLHLRNANAGAAYTSPTGTAATWQTSAACIRVGDGHNVSVIGNEMDGCANGAVSLWNGKTWGGSSLNHLWEGNYVHGSGTSGSSDNHQLHLEAWGQVVQFNRVDLIAAGSTGANLKSRGVQDVIRYNYFGDGPARNLDLVDVGSAAQFMSFSDFLSNNPKANSATYSMDQLAAWQEAWNSHFAYGNVYLNSTSIAPIHFAYDQTGAEPARKGSLYWYNNTFYKSTCTTCTGQLWTMFDTSGGAGSFLPQTEFQNVQVFNDLLWMDSTSMPTFQWNNFDAFIGLGASNLLPAGWGTDTLKGGTGDGWNDIGNAAAYQNAANLLLHITGFTGTNVQTASAMPFDKTSWVLGGAVPATATLPTAVCEMPVRFTYLPTLSYAVPRVASSNIGATDTVSQTASAISLLGGANKVGAAGGCN